MSETPRVRGPFIQAEVEADLKRRVLVEVARHGLTVSGLVVDALEWYLPELEALDPQS